MIAVIPEEISDDLWAKVEPLIPFRARSTEKRYSRAAGGGRKPIDQRKIFSAILHVLRNRITWRSAPKSLGSVATIHRYFELWKRAGVFANLQRSDLVMHAELQGFPWALCEQPGRPSLPLPRADLKPSRIAKGIRPAIPVETPSAAEKAPPIIHEREPSVADSRMQARILKLHGSTDVSAFWNAAQAILHDAIPHNSIIAYLDYLDHPKTWKAAKILASTNARRPAEWFEERWKLDITPRYLQGHKGIKCFKFSDIIGNSSELQRTDYFKQFFKPFGWHHTACLPFWNDSGINSVIALRRTKEQGDYRPTEIEFLKNIHPHIDTVLRRLLPSQKEQTKLRWLIESTQDIPTTLMLLDWNLVPLHINREAYSQCAVWNFGPQKARAYNPREVYKTPEDIARVCANLKSDWLEMHGGTNEVKDPNLSVKIINGNDTSRTATISLAVANRETLFKPGFRIHFDYRSTDPKSVSETPQPELLWRLTSAERDLFQLASIGCNNAEIATKLCKSINTVKHQFTSIYSKLGVDSPRKRFLYRVL